MVAPIRKDNIMPEKVEHPAHYNKGGIEVIDFILDKDLSFVEGNVVKYVCRYNFKGHVEDLRKAKFYLELLIAEKESGI